MGFFDEMENELLGEQEKKKEKLNIKPKTSKAKVDLHVTIPKDTKEKLEARAKQEHRSVANMLEIILEQGLNNF